MRLRGREGKCETAVWGVCGDTTESVFFISTVLLYIMHLQSSTCLYLWYKFGIFSALVEFLKSACISITTLQNVQEERQFEVENCKHWLV